MSKQSDRKLALADLMARAEQRKQVGPVTKEVYVDLLGGCLTVEKLPLGRVLPLLDDVDGKRMMSNLDFQVDLIYQSCPVLRDRGLQESYGCQEPTDIVCALLEDNISAIGSLSTAILEFYGLGDDQDAVKN